LILRNSPEVICSVIEGNCVGVHIPRPQSDPGGMGCSSQVLFVPDWLRRHMASRLPLKDKELLHQIWDDCGGRLETHTSSESVSKLCFRNA
jgi:hypothetical protein